MKNTHLFIMDHINDYSDTELNSKVNEIYENSIHLLEEGKLYEAKQELLYVDAQGNLMHWIFLGSLHPQTGW